MKLTGILLILAIISLMAPVMAELNDYQKGVQDGLTAGIKMGALLGAAPYNSNSAQQYNSMLNAYNARLQTIFGPNQTAIKLFWMYPLSGQTTGYQPYPTLSSRPIHAIDSSWNQTATYNPDIKNKIHGYDPDTYYTMMGWGNAPAGNGYADNLGGV